MIGKTAQRLLKAIHIASAGVWLGGLIAIVVLLVVGPHESANRARFGLDLGAYTVHDTMLFWAFVATLVTGFLFALLTTWGFFRHDWLTAKWLLASALFVLSLWFQSPSIATTAGLADAGLEHIAGLDYAQARHATLELALAQLAIVIAVFGISSLKPWGQRRFRRALPRRVIAPALLALAGLGAAFGAWTHQHLDGIRALPIDDVAPATRRDGTWTGAVTDCGAPYAVEVTIRDGSMISAVATHNIETVYGRLGEAVLRRIVAEGTTVVDAITGATTTSRCLARATASALRNAPVR
jgi:uncharacterized protein with FMN-binding domain